MTKETKGAIEEAQSHIDGLKVAEIIRDAQAEFRDEYPASVFALGVGPIQAMLGLAIKNGHIAVKNEKVVGGDHLIGPPFSFLKGIWLWK